MEKTHFSWGQGWVFWFYKKISSLFDSDSLNQSGQES